MESKGKPELGVHDAMFTLRAMRRLKPDPIAEDDLCYIVEAATMACSPGNSQPWKFLIVTDPVQKERVAAVYRELGNRIIRDDVLASGRLDGATEQVYRNAMLLVDNMQHAPALVLCCVHGRSEEGEIHQSSYYGGIYPAIQNLMLAARAKGIGSTLTTLHKARERDIKAIFGIPDDVSTIALVPLGYPEGKWGRPRRKPQPEVTYWNRWGAENDPSPPD